MEENRKKMVYKTFGELCPLWNQRLTEGPQGMMELRVFINEIHAFQTCVVGEAYGYNRLRKEDIEREHIKTFVPKCSKCANFGEAMAKTYQTYRSGIFEIIKDFVEHFNESHREHAAV